MGNSLINHTDSMTIRVGETSQDEFEPCEEFLKFRELLDQAGVEWRDASDLTLLPRMGIYRTHGNGFSCIYGTGTYGMERGLLELAYSYNGRIFEEPIGCLTAQEAFDTCANELGWNNE